MYEILGIADDTDDFILIFSSPKSKLKTHHCTNWESKFKEL